MPIGEFIDQLPPRFRAPLYAGVFTASMTVWYFVGIAGPLDSAVKAANENRDRITEVHKDIKAINGRLSTVEQNQAVNGQKLQDVGEDVKDIKSKLDFLVESQINQNEAARRRPPPH